MIYLFNMHKTIIRAKLILSNIFKIDKINFDTKTTRKNDVVEARRFLIYFLRKEFGLTYYEICKFCPSITNHASAIHHFKRMKELIEFESPLKKLYNRFYNEVMGDDKYAVEKELSELNNNKDLINKQISVLKKML
tara:strand:+ start:732 stop:1139 length:408 start_codon:yes stop_codon:yes gene_type:complete